MALVLVISLSSLLSTGAPQGQLPRTGLDAESPLPELILSQKIQSLPAFRTSVMNGKSDELAGVWIDDILTYRIVQSDGLNVPQAENTAAIYSWAERRGVTALMIHNTMGGSALYEVEPGMQIALIYGDGQVVWYISRGITTYEAQSYTVDGFQGPFRRWDCTGCSFGYSVEEIQQVHYAGTPHLAFQTCLEDDGRMGFLILEADPIDSALSTTLSN